MPVFRLSPSDLLNALSDLNNPQNLNLLKYFQITQSTGLFLIPPFILAFLFSDNSFSYLKINNTPLFAPSLISIVIIIISLPIINFATEINQGLNLPEWLSSLENWMKSTEESAYQLTKAFLNVTTIEGLMVNLFMIAVIPALGEELLFRGIIQRLFSEWTKNIHLGIFITAILFSALHFQFFGFLPRTLLGILFGYLFVFSGSIWYPIIAHFFNNAMAVFVYFFLGSEVVENTIDKMGTEGVSVILVMLGIGILYLLIRYFKSFFKPA